MSYTPWFKEPLWACSTQDEGRMLQLHGEIEDFYEQARPKQQDEEKRAQALERVKVAIQALWPFCEVKVFGSFATGLYLPNISDIDIVILGSSSGQGLSDSGRLWDLGAALRSSGIAKHVEIIGRAKVPIVKFEEARSGIAFDVRFDSHQELRAADFILSTLAAFPCLAPLYLFLKTFLHRKHLNEVYHTGGLASYTLFVMLFTFLQVHPGGRQDLSSSGLGVLLAGFFHLYGVSLNVREYGISCNGGGAHFFLKTHRKFLDAWKPYLLAVEDPLMPSNDIGKNSFNFPRIQASFKESYNLLMSSHLNDESVSLLKLILPRRAGDSKYI